MKRNANFCTGNFHDLKDEVGWLPCLRSCRQTLSSAPEVTLAPWVTAASG